MLQSNKKLDLKNDIVFKEFFSKKGNEIFAKEFLSSLLKINIEKIEIRKDVALQKDTVEEKYGVLDLQVTLNNSKIIDIEMQLLRKENFFARAEYYASKLTSSQLNISEHYNSLKPVIVVALLNYNLFEYNDYFSESITFIKKHPEIKLDMMHKYYFIELGKYRKTHPDLSEKLNQWLTFIDGTDKKGVDYVLEVNKTIKKAKEELEYLTGDEEIARRIELREKAIRDEMSIREAGKNDGILIGKKFEKIEIAKNMKKANMDIKIISEITGLSIEQINKI